MLQHSVNRSATRISNSRKREGRLVRATDPYLFLWAKVKHQSPPVGNHNMRAVCGATCPSVTCQGWYPSHGQGATAVLDGGGGYSSPEWGHPSPGLRVTPVLDGEVPESLCTIWKGPGTSHWGIPRKGPGTSHWGIPRKSFHKKLTTSCMVFTCCCRHSIAGCFTVCYIPSCRFDCVSGAKGAWITVFEIPGITDLVNGKEIKRNSLSC